jgi:hypothetical protein
MLWTSEPSSHQGLRKDPNPQIIHARQKWRTVICCLCGWKVGGSIPDVVIPFFDLLNPSSRSMALYPGIFLGIKGGRRVRLTTCLPSVGMLPRQRGASPSQPSRLQRPVARIALPFVIAISEQHTHFVLMSPSDRIAPGTGYWPSV